MTLPAVGFWGLVGAFCFERAHQWLSLATPPSFRRDGVGPGGRAVVLLALAIGFGEAIGLYVNSNRGDLLFWRVVFWAMVVHAGVSWWQWRFRARLPDARNAAGPLIGDALLVIGAMGLTVLRSAKYEPDDGLVSWFGMSGLPAFTQRVEAWLPLSVSTVGAAILAFDLMRHGASRVRDSWLVPIAGVFAANLLVAPGPELVMWAILVLHAVPALVVGAFELRAVLRWPAVLLALAAAFAEWWIASRSIWFPDGALFPDLMDWWDLGPQSGFLLHPVWLTPFLAHILLDFFRYGAYFRPCASASSTPGS